MFNAGIEFRKGSVPLQIDITLLNSLNPALTEDET